MKENQLLIFLKDSATVAAEGNRPLLITDPEQVWVLAQGKAAVFAVRIVDGEVRGTRDFLFEVEAGGILCGVEPAGEDQTGLLVSGLTGTRLMQTDPARLRELAGQEAVGETLVPLIRDWVNALAGDAAIGVAPEVRLLPDTEEMIWINYPPLADELITLDRFHSLALQAISRRCQKQKQEEKRRLAEKEKNDQVFFAEALRGILSVTEPERAGEAPAEAAADPLLAACRLVGKAMKMEIVPSPRAAKGIPAKDPLGDIARASGVRIRRVMLRGDWYKRDNGPLLAFTEEGSRPVALLPLSPAQYRLHDPADGTSIPVNEQVAAGLKPFAVFIYRPFPKKPLDLRDVLIFGVENSWRQDLVTVMLMGLLGGLLGMIIPIATGIIFDTIIPGGEQAQLVQIAFFLVAGALGGMLFQVTRSLAMLRLEGRMEGSTQAAVWDRLLSLPAPFFKEYTAGELAMRAMGLSQIRKMLSGAVLTTIISSLFSVFNFGLLFYYDAKLAGVATILVVVAVAATVLFQLSQMRYQRKTVDITNKIAGLVLQLIGSVTKLRVAGAEKRAFYLWSKEFIDLRKTEYKSRTITNWLATFNAVFPVVASIVIFYALVKVTQNSMGAGKFIAFNAALTSFMGAVIALFQTLISVNVIIPLYERIKPILQAMPEYDESKSDPGELTGAIEVSHVSFRYKKEAPLVLDDVSLQVQAGEYIGIVGTSGSGKSTLFRILLGFEKPEAGQIFYNGQNLEKVDIRSVRSQLGVVMQNGQVMAGNILNNIIGANLHLTIDDAWEAARMAGLDQDIKAMAMGMHTVISEGAGTISGGQRQRLLIARAIVNRPKILYFDEATSALDNRTQAIVSESLEQLKSTRVVIAHRLSTVVKCDKIIVMDKGKVVETGTYEELMEKDGMFAELAKRQLA